MRAGGANPLVEDLLADNELTSLVPPGRVRELLDVRRYVGDAPERCRTFVSELRALIREERKP